MTTGLLLSTHARRLTKPPMQNDVVHVIIKITSICRRFTSSKTVNVNYILGLPACSTPCSIG